MITQLSEHGVRGGRKSANVAYARLAVGFCASNFLVIALLAQTPPVDVNLPNTTVTSGIYTYQASSSVEADNGFLINGSATVTFNAGTLIHLGPGFQAATGSAFHAVIGVQGGGSGSLAQPISASASATAGPGPTMFTFVTAYPGNWQNIDSVYILLNGTLDGTDACYVLYSRTANAIYLRDDRSIEWMGGTVPGVPQIPLNNNQCSLDVASSSITGSGSNLTINLSLSFNSTFNGVQNVFMEAFDINEGVSGYYQMPIGYTAYTANSQSPSGSVSPPPSSGLAQSFTFHATSVNGYRYLSQETILFSANPNTTANACSLVYLRGPNVLYLVGDNGTGWVDPPLTPGASGAVSNSQCTVDSGISATVSTNSLDLPVYVQFNPAFAGAKAIYQALYDHTGKSQGWQPVGTWTVPAPLGPLLKITTSSLPGGTVNQGYSSGALTATGGTGPYTWSLISGPPFLRMLAGMLQGTPTQRDTYTVMVQVSDGVSQVQRSFSISIAPEALAIQTTSLPYWTALLWYNQQLTATGGYPPYTWSVTGLDNSGLTASGGWISGYPAYKSHTAYAVHALVRVTDSQGTSWPTMSSPALDLGFNISPGPLTINNVYPLPSATENQPYSFTFTSTGGGGTPNWRVVGTPIVNGLILDATGLLHGNPASGTARDYDFSVLATDGASSPTQGFHLTVKPSLASNPTVTCSASPPSIALGGGPVRFTATGTGGTPGYTYLWPTPVGQVGPGGLTLDFTPQQTQIYTAIVGVTDSAGRSSSSSCSVNVTSATGTAKLIAPTPGMLNNNLVTFRWNSGLQVNQYSLSIGTDSDAKNIFNQAEGDNVFIETVLLPQNGCDAVNVKLGSQFAPNTWLYETYTFPRSCTLPTLPKEYIRVGGRVIAIENP